MKAAGIVLMMAAAGLAQNGPAFDVASIKLSGPQSIRERQGGPGSSDPTRYSFHQAPLRDLIGVAFNAGDYTFATKVELGEQPFDLDVTIPPGTTRTQFQKMLQGLLAERFHLKTHVESREVAGFDLTVAKTGLRLKEGVGKQGADESDGGFPEVPEGRPGAAWAFSGPGHYQLARLRVRQETMSRFAQFLQRAGEGPIVDKTGLTGKYDFTFEYTVASPGASTDEAPVAPDLFVAIQEQLGLKLTPNKLRFDVVVVDSADKLPVEN